MIEKIAFKITQNLIKIIIISFTILVVILLLGTLIFKGSEKLSLSGYLNPKNVEYIKPKISGIVSKVYVKENSKAKKGQFLIELDHFDLSKQIENLKNEIKLLNESIRVEEKKFENNLLTIKHRIKKAKLDYSYVKMELEKLEKEDEITKMVMSDSKTAVIPYNIKLKRKQLKSNKENLEVLKEDEKNIKLTSFKIKQLKNNLQTKNNMLLTLKKHIDKSKIISPISGYIVGNDIDKLTGSLVNKGQSLFTVSDFSEWIIDVFIPEMAITKIQIGQPVKIYINAIPYMKHQIFTGRVLEISIAPIKNSTTGGVFYRGKIEITDTDFKKYVDKALIKPGMNVKVRIILKHEQIFKLLLKKN